MPSEVSILVLMDVVLQGQQQPETQSQCIVSILVLMDVVLQGGDPRQLKRAGAVSILVLMDVVLQVYTDGARKCHSIVIVYEGTDF